ncbi:putative polymerase [Hyphomicrobiales bacterium]|nr:putative polymerase [Hyphomicrobiales bacterium]CAH1685724.1 putative polymerase [Hyphomicrobiales bacterium]
MARPSGGAGCLICRFSWPLRRLHAMSVAQTPNSYQTLAMAPAQSDFRQSLVLPILLAALAFNFALCFVNTNVMGVSASMVMLVEVMLVGCTFLLIADRSPALYFVLLGIFSYVGALMLFRGVIDPKILRDLMIPVVFFILGLKRGNLALGDRAVTWSILIVLGAALFEWMFLDTFLKYFDVIGYYVSRGSVDAAATTGEAGLFVSGTRFEGRTLLPFLGEHRVSSVFLEPVSVGNFGAVAFAWVLSRDIRRPQAFISKTLAIMTILVLGDARFGMYLCGITLGLYLVAPLVRPGMVFVAPFLAIIALITYASVKGNIAWDNTIFGRFLLAGQLINTLGLGEAMGLVYTSTDFNDSGYAYALSQLGVLGFAGVWALFVFVRVPEGQPRRFMLFVAFYIILLLCISVSFATIKTAALLWFLAGICARSPEAMAWDIEARRYTDSLKRTIRLSPAAAT